MGRNSRQNNKKKPRTHKMESKTYKPRKPTKNK